MNNKIRTCEQFCSDENLQYITKMIKWTGDQSRLHHTMVTFMNNNGADVSNFEDMWKSVRSLNRRFIETVDLHPSTKTEHNTLAEWYLWNQEIIK